MMKSFLVLLLYMTGITSLGQAFILLGSQNPDIAADQPALYNVRHVGSDVRRLGALLDEISRQNYSPDKSRDGWNEHGQSTQSKEYEEFHSRSPILMALLGKFREYSPSTSNRYTNYQLKAKNGANNLEGMDVKQSNTGVAGSSDMGTNIDDVIASLSNTQKRSREGLDGAMPPVNELCRMMHIRCY